MCVPVSAPMFAPMFAPAEANHHPCLVWPDSVVPLWLAVLLGRQYDGSRTTLTRVNPEVVVVGGNGHPLPAGRGSDRLAGL